MKKKKKTLFVKEEDEELFWLLCKNCSHKFPVHQQECFLIDETLDKQTDKIYATSFLDAKNICGTNSANTSSHFL